MRREKIFLIWAVVATACWLTSTGVALYLPRVPRSPAVLPESPVRAKAFLDLPDNAMVGKYRLIDLNGDNPITLLEDHTFLNRDGIKFPIYHWEITRDALLLTFKSNHTRLTAIEAPGVYVAFKDGVEIARLIRVNEASPP
jgi:hypothetical protein